MRVSRVLDDNVRRWHFGVIQGIVDAVRVVDIKHDVSNTCGLIGLNIDVFNGMRLTADVAVAFVVGAIDVVIKIIDVID